MKKNKAIYWVTTTLIFLFEGVLPAFTSQTDMAKEGIRHLGYPDYFGIMLAVFKVLGAIVLIVPGVSSRIKEWAYAGFAIDFISAFVSTWAVDGFSITSLFPLVVLAILIISNVYYYKVFQNN